MMTKTLSIAAALIVAFSLTAASAGAADDMKSWQRSVVMKIAKKQKYPRAALAREIEGKARVKLTVAADGTITSHEVTQPTGEAILDREIPKLMKRLSPLPTLPDGRESLTFVLPLDWSLN